MFIVFILLVGAVVSIWQFVVHGEAGTAVPLTPPVNLSQTTDNGAHVGDTNQQTHVTINFPTPAPTPFVTIAPTATPQPTPTPVMEIPTLVYEVSVLSEDVKSLKAIVHALSMATPYPTPTPLPVTRIKQDVALIAFGVPVSILFLAICVALLLVREHNVL